MLKFDAQRSAITAQIDDDRFGVHTRTHHQVIASEVDAPVPCRFEALASDIVHMQLVSAGSDVAKHGGRRRTLPLDLVAREMKWVIGGKRGIERRIHGRLPRPGTDEVIVGKGIYGRFKGLAEGGSFDLRRNRPLHVVGEFSADGSSYESEVWGDLDKVRTSLGREAVGDLIDAASTSMVGRLAATVDRLRREVQAAQAEADGRALIELAKGILVERLGCGLCVLSPNVGQQNAFADAHPTPDRLPDLARPNDHDHVCLLHGSRCPNCQSKMAISGRCRELSPENIAAMTPLSISRSLPVAKPAMVPSRVSFARRQVPDRRRASISTWMDLGLVNYSD